MKTTANIPKKARQQTSAPGFKSGFAGALYR